MAVSPAVSICAGEAAGSQEWVVAQPAQPQCGCIRLIGPELIQPALHGWMLAQISQAQRAAGSIRLADGAQQGRVAARQRSNLAGYFYIPGQSGAAGIALHVPGSIALAQRAKPDGMGEEQLCQLVVCVQGAAGGDDIRQLIFVGVAQGA